MKIPSGEDWGNWQGDLDQRWAYKMFFGKNIEEAKELFKENAIERTSELRFMPEIPFQYYLFSFREYVLSKEAKGDSDAASCYLRLIQEKLLEDPNIILPIMDRLIDSTYEVAENQAYYDAPLNIYGDFKAIYQSIKELHTKSVAGLEDGSHIKVGPH